MVGAVKNCMRIVNANDVELTWLVASHSVHS